MTDLLGDEIQPGKRTNDRPEAAALAEGLLALKAHPAVAWAHQRTARGLEPIGVGGRFRAACGPATPVGVCW